jgi:HEAT repeat protein
MWGGLGLALGVLGFALSWIPRLGPFGMGLGGVGLALALAGAYLCRRAGATFPLTAAVVAAQTLIAGTFLTYAREKPEAPQQQDEPKVPQRILDGKGQPAKPRAVQNLLDALKDDKAETRAAALEALGDLARGIADSAPVLTEMLFNEADTKVRAEVARTLGLVGPHARAAYPALLYVSRADPDVNVRHAANNAMERIGRPTSADIPILLDGLANARADYRAAAAQTLTWVVTPETKNIKRPLERALKDDDARVRVFAAQAHWIALRKADAVLPVLTEALKHPTDPGVRSGAAHVLAMMDRDARPALDQLVRVMTKDDDVSVRLYAAIAHWGIERQADPVLPVFIAALRAREPAQRAAAAEALSKLGRSARPAVPALVEALKGDDLDLRGRAAYALGLIGEDAWEATPQLVRLARSGDQNLREQAVHTLSQIGPRAKEAVPLLIDLLDEKSPALRGRAALALGAIGPDARAALERLVQALADERDPSIRLFVAQALWTIDSRLEQALPAICELVADAGLDADLRATAVGVLGRIGPQGKMAIPALNQAREDADETLAGLIDAALDRIGAVGKDDVPAVLRALKSDKKPYRKLALQTLWIAAREAKEAKDLAGAVPALIGLLKDDDRDMRLMAAEVLEAVGPEAKAAVLPLAELLKGKEDDDVKVAALDALAAMGEAALPALAAIQEHLKAKEPRLRVMAAAAVGACGPMARAALPALETLLTDDDALVRVNAAFAMYLVDKNLRKSVPVLHEAIKGKDADVVAAAAAALGHIGPAARETADTLRGLARSPNENVRKAAAEALKAIEAPPP